MRIWREALKKDFSTTPLRMRIWREALKKDFSTTLGLHKLLLLKVANT